MSSGQISDRIARNVDDVVLSEKPPDSDVFESARARNCKTGRRLALGVLSTQYALGSNHATHTVSLATVRGAQGVRAQGVEAFGFRAQGVEGLP